MLSTLVTILVFALICGVILYCARLVVTALPIAQPWANIAYACVLLILLVLFLNEIGWAGHARAWRTW